MNENKETLDQNETRKDATENENTAAATDSSQPEEYELIEVEDANTPNDSDDSEIEEEVITDAEIIDDEDLEAQAQETQLDIADLDTRIDDLNRQIAGVMKKYKMTFYIMIVCIAVYLVLLFWVHNLVLLVIVCVPMLACAFYNSKVSKQLRALMGQRNTLQAKKDALTRAAETGESLGSLTTGSDNSGEAIVANAKSLNDLPKEYTVVDDVEWNGEVVPHIILSPYGVALVDENDRTADMKELLEELELESPVFLYAPEEDVALLAEKIQQPKEVVLTEPDIFKILYKITGLK